jgi:phage-related protein
MNVLPDKTSGKSKDNGAGGTGGLDPGDAAALDDIFGNIGKKLQEVSGWAKVFAGILAGIAGFKFLKGLLGELNDTVDTFKKAKDNADSFAKTMKNVGKTTADAFKKGSPFVKQAGTLGTDAGTAIISGISSVIGAAAGNIWKFLFAPLIGAAATALEFIGTLFLLTFLGAAEVVALPAEAVIAIGAVIVAAIVGIGYLIYRNWDTIWKAMKTVVEVTWQAIQKIWDGVVNFFVGIWHGIYNAFVSIVGGIKSFFEGIVNFVKQHATIFEIIFSPVIFAVAAVILVVTGLIAFFKFVFDSIVSIFSAAPGFFQGVFQAAWDFIVAIWSVVVAFFQAIWDGIVAIFTVVATFFATVFKAAWDAIVAVWTVVSTWFMDHVITPLINLFTPIVEFYIRIFTDAWNGIKAVWNVVAGFFTGVWNQIKGVFGAVGDFFANAFRNAYDRVTSVFSGLWSWFKTNVWDRITSLFSQIGTTVGNAIGAAFKGVVNSVLRGIGNIWNGFVNLLNGAINVVNKLPGVNLPKVATWQVPQLAKGGIIDQPTIAQLGEAGKEAVIPLENNTDWIDTLASKINDKNKSGQPVQLVVQIGEDKIASKVIDLINEKTVMSGRNAIYV